MYIFDRWSPYSYQNNRDKYADDDEKREFNMKECLWFCMTSLTPQGGGEAPKSTWANSYSNFEDGQFSWFIWLINYILCIL